MNKYEKSWSIYKSHSELFQDDFEYYLNFSKGFKTLETFAGYGRVTNYLLKNGVDIYANELSQDFANFIEIEKNKIYVCDILNINTQIKFERIFASYNSFCLLTKKDDLIKLFKVLDNLLSDNGKISLSYYHPKHWSNAYSYDFDFEGETIKYTPSFSLERYSERIGIWKDKYESKSNKFEYSYEVKIFDNSSEIQNLLAGTRLKLTDEIEDYKNPNIVEPGWIEYIFEKY